VSSGYLDIETTGFDPEECDLTVIGIYVDDEGERSLTQLVGDDITAAGLMDLVKPVRTLYTYNGERFDLPYIKAKLGLDLTLHCEHRDLMHACHRRGLYGGMKNVERMLGIKRKLAGVDGRLAIQLWRDYKLYDCADSLAALLEYNKEDVVNLKLLRDLLERETPPISGIPPAVSGRFYGRS